MSSSVSQVLSGVVGMVMKFLLVRPKSILSEHCGRRFNVVARCSQQGGRRTLMTVKFQES